jgi:hypothetical protein
MFLAKTKSASHQNFLLTFVHVFAPKTVKTALAKCSSAWTTPYGVISKTSEMLMNNPKSSAARLLTPL